MDGSWGCHWCGSTQHFVRDCSLPREPSRSMVQGRVFAITAPEAATTPEVIQEILYISDIPARVLVDLGATHSFYHLCLHLK